MGCALQCSTDQAWAIARMRGEGMRWRDIADAVGLPACTAAPTMCAVVRRVIGLSFDRSSGTFAEGGKAPLRIESVVCERCGAEVRGSEEADAVGPTLWRHEGMRVCDRCHAEYLARSPLRRRMATASPEALRQWSHLGRNYQ